MDSVPLYLLAYFLKVRQGAGHVGYMKRRLEDADLFRASDEKSMVSALYELNLVALDQRDDELLFDKDGKQVKPGLGLGVNGAVFSVKVPRAFVVTARGKYVWVELLCKFAAWLATAVVCGLAGGLAAASGADDVGAWVVVVLALLLLGFLVTAYLVHESPHA